MIPEGRQIRRSSLAITVSRNIAVTDIGLHLFSSLTTDITLTIPQDTFGVDREIEVAADSTGKVLIAVSGTVTINGAATMYTVNAGAAAYIRFRSANAVRIWGGI